MQEDKVTVDGVTHQLPTPFIVIASQLTYGHEGTYPFTEVQIDRFMLRIWSGHASKQEEIDIVSNIDYIDTPDIHPVTTPEEIVALRNAVKKVHVSPEVIDYIVTLVEWLRQSPDIQLGPSARASIALLKCSRSLAFLNGRDFVIPDDVKRLAYPVMEHRILIKTETEMEDIAPRDIIERALKAIPVPKVK
jgi:MoxR-like ATPase